MDHMRFAWFLRRRTILVPTAVGWAVLAAAGLALGATAARALPAFLAVDAPVGGQLLVVEGWLPQGALDAAAEVARRGPYRVVAVTGGPVRDVAWAGGYATYAERAGAYLRRLDLGGRELVVVPARENGRDRTWESARALRRWLEAEGRTFPAADVLTSGPHARRSRALFRLALTSDTSVGSLAIPSPDYDLARWWRRSDGARDVLGEAIGYGWMLCCFWPDAGR
jgi:uncharacterized SAM-binding protein YcdF (DUF218 family)